MGIISTKLMGGLGNYMFQISAAFAISLRDNKELICETYDTQVPQKPVQTYENNLFKKVKFTSEHIAHIPYGEPKFSFSEIPFIEGNMRLYGYFQSEKYFTNYRKEVLELFDLNQEIQEKIQEKYQEVLSKNPTSLHVRRGDYVWLNDYHANQQVSYYQEAMNWVGRTLFNFFR
jgi:hypothetical protein